MVIFLLLGYPFSFSLARHRTLVRQIAIDLGLLQPRCCRPAERVYRIIRNDTLLAIPFSPSWG